MDRVTVYPGAIPREVDLLYAGKFPMVGLGYLAEAVLGSGAIVDGFALAATTPASMSLTLDRGSIYQPGNTDPTAFSSLPADTHTIIKQGVREDASNIAFTAPATVGFSQVFLVEAAFDDEDTDLIALPYFNAADPTDPWTGPGNNGQTQPTIRRGRVVVQVKAGVAASTGAQVAPTPDAGWTGLWLVTLNAGQTTITSSSITRYPAAPFLDTKLPNVPGHSQSGRWSYGLATGTNALTVSLAPTPLALPDGMVVYVGIPADNTTAMTLTVSGFSSASIVRLTGGAVVAGDVKSGSVVGLVRKGNDWRLLAPVKSEYEASIATYSPQRLAFDQYFTDDNPVVDANVNYDTDGDAGTLPGLALKAYEYTYTSAFPGEKTLINVVIISNINVQRPGTANVKAYVRAQATNAVGVNRNNYVTIDSTPVAVNQDWKSISVSMLVGKNSGTATSVLRLYCWWQENTPGVGGDPYRVFLDDCEILIIERVVTAFPSFPYAN